MLLFLKTTVKLIKLHKFEKEKMLVVDLITDEIPPLKTTDTVELALDWMEQFKVSHLPVVKDRELIGLVSESDLLDYNHPEEQIDASKLHLMRPVIHLQQHTYGCIFCIINKHSQDFNPGSLDLLNFFVCVQMIFLLF